MLKTATITAWYPKWLYAKIYWGERWLANQIHRTHWSRHFIQIHRQEDQLIEQLHARVGRPTMQTIERAPEWECQLSRLESVHAEVLELLEGQDLNVLLHTRSDIKEKLGKLMQLEVAGNLPSTTVPQAHFRPQPLCLGHLVFPGDPESMKIKQPTATLSQVVK